MRTAWTRRPIALPLWCLAAGACLWGLLAGLASPQPPGGAPAADPGLEKYIPSPEQLEAPLQRQRPPARAEGVYKAQLMPHWFADNTRFWYRNDLRGGAREFILVEIDAERAVRKSAFDHAKLAAPSPRPRAPSTGRTAYLLTRSPLPTTGRPSPSAWTARSGSVT